MNNKLDEYYSNIDIPDNIDEAIKCGITKANKKRHLKKIYLKAAASAASIALIIFIFAIKIDNTVTISKNEQVLKTSLPVIGSVDNLNKLIEIEIEKQNNIDYSNNNVPKTNSKAINNDSKKETASESQATDYSSTNIQVQGVDEDDTVKTDGKYTYSTNQNKINIVEAVPAESMKNINTITIDDKNCQISGIYLNKNYLIAISYISSGIIDGTFKSPNTKGTAKIIDTINRNVETKLTVFDINNIQSIKKIREINFSGSYVTSRIISSKLYLVTNKYINYDYNHKTILNSDLPYYRDSKNNNSAVSIDLSKTHYIPDITVPSFMCIGLLDINNLDKGINFSAFLSSSGCIYASKNNLYIANNYYRDFINKSTNYKTSSKIFKFSLNENNVEYAGEAEIPGTILNQFSMDENNGYLRVTSSESNLTNSNSQTNNIFVLDKNMNLVGKLNNLEPGERIYSTRFIGDKAYVVTYKNTDPLLVIDLKNPSSPTVLGELKIPGFSTYLQSYDDTHLIGIGMNTNEENNRVKTDGIKLSLFDISNLSSPKELSSIKVDLNYSNSEALYDYKAFLFSKSKKIIAFPVMGSTIEGSQFNGAYVYNIDLNSGITLKGKITHANMDNNDASYIPQINRIIYINDDLYTFSQTEIKANKISDLSESGTVKLAN